MLFLDLANCGPSGILKVIYFFKLIIDIVFVIIPIALIVLLTIDFSKAMISGDEGAQKKAFNLGLKRILYAVIVFCVPYIVSILNLVLGELGVDYSACYYDINMDTIKQLEADEIVIEETKKAARKALLEKKRKEKEEQEKIKQQIDSSGGGSSSITVPKKVGCDGYVYYENGTFYKPSSSSLNGVAGSKGSAPYGYNKYFYSMLNEMINDGKAAGVTIKASTGDGAWRSLERQKYYRNCYLTKKCNNGNQAAVPGTSRHGWGIASDLSYGSSSAIKWAHNNAYKYGLKFTVASENWHIEPASQSVNDSVVKKCM